MEIPEDIALIIGDKTESLAQYFASQIRQGSIQPYWQWAELHKELPPQNADASGKINYDLFPASKFFFEWAKNPRNRRCTGLCCSQSCKTEDMITIIQYDVSEDPTPTMWVMAVADQCKEFGKDRLFPAFENCASSWEHAPKDRRHWTSNYIKFDTMSLFLRGANSKAKLKSSPIGKIICDERDMWAKGAINTLRKRLTTFSDPREFSMGVGGVVNDELHTDWKSGSQTFYHFRCVKCGCSQPWRFGKASSVYWKHERACGGVVFDNYDVTRPNGIWELDAVEREAKWECENADCRYRHDKSDKLAMIKSCHEYHSNPRALPAHYSFTRQLAMLNWDEADWGKIARRFIEAKMALKHGDVEKMKTWVQEDCGEPWESPVLYHQAGDISDRKGEYKLGQMWMDIKEPDKMEKNTVLILTFDRQLMQKLRYVVRQWRTNGQSRLVWEGWKPSLDDLRAFQLEKGIKDKCMWGDAQGPKVSEFRMFALRVGWGMLSGESEKYFSISETRDGKKVQFRQGWRLTSFDPGIGTSHEGRLGNMEATLWSNFWYKDKLYFHFIKGGFAPLWEYPSDVSGEYISELGSCELREKELSDGTTEQYFHKTGPDHAADCEQMQLVVADRAGFTRYLPQVKK